VMLEGAVLSQLAPCSREWATSIASFLNREGILVSPNSPWRLLGTLTPDEVFRRLASLPREMVMDEASRLVDMTSPSLKEVTLGRPTKSWRITSPG